MKTKNLLAAGMLLLMSCTVMAQDLKQAAPAADLMEKAFAQAKLENKKVFLMFHASWCGWCHRMDSLMNREDTKEMFDRNYVTVHLVVTESKDKKHLENPGAEELRKDLKCEKTGIPFWVVYDKERQVMADAFMRPDGAITGDPGQNTGCPATQEEVDHWIKVLKATTDMTGEELALVARLFKR